MITTNIDGLTNGAMGTVTNVVIDQTTGRRSVILVAFASEPCWTRNKVHKCL